MATRKSKTKSTAKTKPVLPKGGLGGRKKKLWFWALVSLFVLLLIPVVSHLLISSFHSTVRVKHIEGVKKTEYDGLYFDRLKVCIYNVAHGRGQNQQGWMDEMSSDFDKELRRPRYQKIIEGLKEADADILILNEVDFDCFWSGNENYAELIAKELGYPYVVEQDNFYLHVMFNQLSFGSALLSRFPIRSTENLNFPAYSKMESFFFGHKKGVVCDMELPDGHTLKVLPIHLDHRDRETRMASAQLIRNYTQGLKDNFLAAGDFNAERSKSEEDRTAISVLERGDHFFKSGLQGEVTKRDYTYPTIKPSKKIDWLMLKGSAVLAHEKRLTLPHSDHFPVVGEVLFFND